MNEEEGLQALSGAVIKGQYRYHLWRQWDAQRPRVTFVLLNPSTADASHNDPTIRRCIDFAREWGFGCLSVVNLYAWRSPSPQNLTRVADPVGPENDAYLSAAAAQSACLIAAWGRFGRYSERDREVMELLIAYASRLFCLSLNQDGSPKHPLYIKKGTQRQCFHWS